MQELNPMLRPFSPPPELSLVAMGEDDDVGQVMQELKPMLKSFTAGDDGAVEKEVNVLGLDDDLKYFFNSYVALEVLIKHDLFQYNLETVHGAYDAIIESQIQRWIWAEEGAVCDGDDPQPT